MALWWHLPNGVDDVCELLHELVVHSAVHDEALDAGAVLTAALEARPQGRGHDLPARTSSSGAFAFHAGTSQMHDVIIIHDKQRTSQLRQRT